VEEETVFQDGKSGVRGDEERGIAGSELAKTTIVRRRALEILNNRLAISCSPKGILEHQVNAYIVIELELALGRHLGN
jgi:hypothetical protein